MISETELQEIEAMVAHYIHDTTVEMRFGLLVDEIRRLYGIVETVAKSDSVSFDYIGATVEPIENNRWTVRGPWSEKLHNGTFESAIQFVAADLAYRKNELEGGE